VLQAALCFEYQSCETGDTWKASTAAALIRQAVAYAHGRIIPRGLNGWPLRRADVHAAIRADADSASPEELEAEIADGLDLDPGPLDLEDPGPLDLDPGPLDLEDPGPLDL